MPTTITETTTANTSTTKINQTNDEMRIAWRYNNLDKIDSEQGSGSQNDGKNSYTFDLSQPIESGALSELDLTVFGDDNYKIVDANPSIFNNSVYASLLQALQSKFNDETFQCNSNSGNVTGMDKATKKNLLRICIQSMGSPLWWNENFTQDICLFLTILKAVVRASLTVCCITMPTHLFKHFVSSHANVFFPFFDFVFH